MHTLLSGTNTLLLYYVRGSRVGEFKLDLQKIYHCVSFLLRCPHILNFISSLDVN